MRARRTDANLKSIADAYRTLGCSVHVTNGMWDLTIGYGGISELVEVKDGAKPPSRRTLTKVQVAFRQTWTGGIRLIQTLDDVMIHVNMMMKRHRTLAEASMYFRGDVIQSAQF